MDIKIICSEIERKVVSVFREQVLDITVQYLKDPTFEPITELSEKADIKDFIPVTLTYDSKMYYLEPAVYPIAGIDSLRMFNNDISELESELG